MPKDIAVLDPDDDENGRNRRRHRDRHPLRRNRSEKEESLLDKVMRTRKQLEDKRESYFKPKDGENRIRIMPSWRGVGETFYIQVPTHRNIGPENKWATCLQFWQDECPLCRRIERLSQSDNSRDQNVAQKMQAVDQCLMNIGVPNSKEGVIKIWTISESWLFDILGYFVDPEYGDFTNPYTGFDYIFTRTGTGLKTRYPKKSFARHPSPIKIPGARKKLVNLEQFPKKYTRQQLLAFLRGEEEDE